MSRLPTEHADRDFLIVHPVTLDDGLRSAEWKRIAEETAQDATLIVVRQALLTDQWPKESAIGPYQALRAELSVWELPEHGFIIQRGEILVIPTTATDRVIKQAHDGHPGREKTLARLRGTVWWPGWSKQTRQALTQCETCAAEAAIRPVPLKARDLPLHPWHTVAVDIFYYQQVAFFSLIDLYSRYPVVLRA